MPVWVVFPTGLEGNLYSFAVQLTETIGYWLWQFESFLADPMRDLRMHFSRLVLDLEFEHRDSWLRWLESVDSTPTEQGPLLTAVGANPHEGSLRLKIEPQIIRAMAVADNSGERQLVRELLGAVRDAFSPMLPGIESLMTQHALEEGIERFAPLGLKKELIMLPTGDHLELDPRDLPRFRGLQESEEAPLLDLIGDQLRARGWSEGDIPKEKVTEVLNEAVACLYREMSGLVSTFDAGDLRRVLIGYHEASTRELFLRMLTIPTRLACFEQYDELVKQLSEQLPEVNLVNTAARFLIEYVAAKPPEGRERLSLEQYDRLLALSSHILEWGSLSDLVRFGIARVGLSILQSGRLGLDQEAVTRARDAFLAQATAGEIGRSRGSFLAHWPEPDSQGEVAERKRQLYRELNDAVSEELGFSLTEAAQFALAVYQIGSSQDGPFKAKRLDDLVSELKTGLGWDEDRITAAIGLFALRARAEFLKPPDHKPEEVYPWRFNRALSYMRRPLVLADVGGTRYALWGNRHLYHSSRYLAQLSAGGHLKATSKSMLRTVAQLRNLETRAFEDEVAGAVKTDETVVVTRKKKFGATRMLGAGGEDLGDIDVLVAIPSRHLIVAIECKDFALARTPWEVQSQLQEVFKGTQTHEPTTTKHLRRTAWITDHVSAVLADLGLKETGKWNVLPVLVTDSEMYAAFFAELPFPVVPIQDLKDGNVVAFVSRQQQAARGKRSATPKPAARPQPQ